MNYEEEQLAALHEASHAVVTLALGGRVESVTLDQSIRALEPAMEPWAVAVMSVAGAVGARTLGPNWRSTSREHSPQDLAVAECALGRDRLGSDKIALLERRARDVVLDNARSIHRVANALMRAGSLSGVQAEVLCAGGTVGSVLAAPMTTRPAAAPSSGSLGVVASSSKSWQEWPPDRDDDEPVSRVLVEDVHDLPAVAEAFGLTLEHMASLQFLGRLPSPDRSFYGWVDVA